MSDFVFNNKNNNELGQTGYQIIITILVISSTLSLYANLHVPTRVYDVEGGAIFSNNSTFVFSDGAACTPYLQSPSPIMAPDLYTFPVNLKIQAQFVWAPFDHIWGVGGGVG